MGIPFSVSERILEFHKISAHIFSELNFNHVFHSKVADIHSGRLEEALIR